MLIVPICAPNLDQISSITHIEGNVIGPMTGKGQVVAVVSRDLSRVPVAS